MVIQFFHVKMSPPSRCAYMALKALDLEFEVKIVDMSKGDHKTPEYLAMNARGKIPAIKDGDFAIAESRAIAMYLCNQYEKGDGSKRLYPTDPKARGLVDQMLYVSENMVDMIQKYVNIGGVLFGEEKIDEEKISEVKRALDLYEGYLSKHKYIAGDHLTLADFFMASPVLLLALPGYDDFSSHPKTAAWLAGIRSLPYFEFCNKEGLDMLITMYKSAVARKA